MAPTDLEAAVWALFVAIEDMATVPSPLRHSAHVIGGAAYRLFPNEYMNLRHRRWRQANIEHARAREARWRAAHPDIARREALRRQNGVKPRVWLTPDERIAAERARNQRRNSTLEYRARNAERMREKWATIPRPRLASLPEEVRERRREQMREAGRRHRAKVMGDPELRAAYLESGRERDRRRGKDKRARALGCCGQPS